ncbi:MAG TPA: serine hydrolase domain-containing protein [Terriglobales bacterium]|nr:serine hydrolase domain-containing protein [Terriglobales bacterium]
MFAPSLRQLAFVPSLRRLLPAVAIAFALSARLLPQAPPPATSFPPGVAQVAIPAVGGVNAALLHAIAPVVERAIARGAFPGAVVLAAHHGRVIYRGVFGNRSIVPSVQPMRFDTMFDLASLTKVIATTPAIMQLLEEGKIRLDEPVAHYWPEFAENGKGKVTIRELLTHTSGLPPDIPSPELLLLLHLPPTGFPGWPPDKNVAAPWHGEAAALKLVEQVALINPPGKKFVYSDINFIVLGYLVERLGGEPLNVYAARHIYTPLGMTSTMFLPPAALKNRIAPTQIINGVLRWGVVHDPTAKAMGGVSGLAGLFSDAHDLGRYAQCLLNGGVLRVSDGHGHRRAARILGPLAVLKMTTPQTPLGLTDIRGLGWDLDSAYSRNRGVLFPIGSFGHTGWTGTSIWIDPVTQTYLIILTSRVHPEAAPGAGVMAVREEVANIVAASLDDVNLRGLSNTGRGERARAYPVN